MEIIQQQDVTEIRKTIEECDRAFGRYELPLSERSNYLEFLDKVSRYANFFVAYEHGVCGCAAAYANDVATKTAYVTLLVVHPNQQGRGVGRLLIQKCIRRAREKAMESIRLEVKEKNTEAISLYEHCGFRFEKHASMDSIYMFMDLR